jgi:hypothetical protein
MGSQIARQTDNHTGAEKMEADTHLARQIHRQRFRQAEREIER